MTKFLRWFRRLGIPVVGLLFYGSLAIVYPEHLGETPAWGSLRADTLAALALGTLFAFFIFEAGIALSRWLDRHMAWQQQPLRRVGLQVGLQAGGAAALAAGLGAAFAHAAGYDRAAPVLFVDLLPLTLLGLLTAFLLAGVYVGASFFAYWQAEVHTREAAQRQVLEAQVHALQQQLDPHFLFNTLSTLTAVIEDSPPRAVTFVQRLATVYRYVLQHRHAARVPLGTELGLVKAYLYLLQTRYPEGLEVELAVPETQHARLVLPMVGQLLVENAVKHNRIEPDEPLLIRIRTEGDWLVVENTPRPLAHPAPASTGVGLRNVQQRYEAAGATQPVRIERTPEWFRVSLPLLPGGAGRAAAWK